MPAPGCTSLPTTRPMASASVVSDLEVDERLEADAPDLLQVAHLGDAGHDRGEDDRRDQHLDQLDEAVAQRLHRLAVRRVEVPEQRAEHHRDEDLEVETAGQRADAHGGISLGSGVRGLSAAHLTPAWERVFDLRRQGSKGAAHQGRTSNRARPSVTKLSPPAL